MLEFAPASGSLALWVQHRDLPDEDVAAGLGRDAASDAAGAATRFATHQATHQATQQAADQATQQAAQQAAQQASQRAAPQATQQATPQSAHLAVNQATSHATQQATSRATHQATSTVTGTRAAVTTDGTHLFYASAFARLPLAQQTGCVAHGVLHIALRHVPRLHALRATLGDVDTQLYNLCADAIVNSALSHLSWLALPTGAVTLERVLDEVLGVAAGAPDAALTQWDVERLYRAVDDRRSSVGGRAATRGPRGGDGTSEERQPGRGGSEPSEADGERATVARGDGPRAVRLRVLGLGTAPDLLPDSAAGRASAAAPEAEAELARDWYERLLRAHAGDGPQSLLRALPADLPRTRTPWEMVLRRHLARGLTRQPGISWSRPARSYLANQGRTRSGRRMPWEPGTTTARTVPRLALVVDVSGSIDASLLARLSSEVAAITRRLEAPVVLVIGDDAVRSVEHCAPGTVDLRRLQFTGGGGTDFTPLLAEADAHAPDTIIVLTDLDGPARHVPRAPVLWAVPDNGAAVTAPFGRVLLLR